MKISIVTPVFNQVKYIEKTIKSVIDQNYPNLEYIIIDGGSTDGTVEIIQKYESVISYWVSEPDKGMYDALNKGFKHSTGEIMAWINGDDLLKKNALMNMSHLFKDLPNVEWVQGMNCAVDLEGNVIDYRYGDKFSLLKFLDKDYKFIQQESTFWRRSLYIRSGEYIDTSLKLAGDFELWFRFAQHAKLYNVPIDIGQWRDRPGQLSREHMAAYFSEAENVINSYELRDNEIRIFSSIKKWRKVSNFIKRLTFNRVRLFQGVILKLYNLTHLDILFLEKTNTFRIK